MDSSGFIPETMSSVTMEELEVNSCGKAGSASDKVLLGWGRRIQTLMGNDLCWCGIML